MSSETLEQLDLEIKRLERDKRVAEIQQIQSTRRTQWITPAALAALLPLAVFGWGEAKKLNEGYRALDQMQQIRSQKEDLERQKIGLNTEISTLLDLKTHYAEQAKELEAKFEEWQRLLDSIYLRAVFYTSESSYALSHVDGMGPGSDRAALQKLRDAATGLPSDAAGSLRGVLDQYELAMEMIGVTQETFGSFRKALDDLPISTWARELKPMPSGYFVANRNIMASGDEKRLFDVDAGRFLTAQEMPQN